MNSEIHNLNELFEKDVIDTNNNIDELLSEDLIYKYKKELFDSNYEFINRLKISYIFIIFICL